MSVRSISSSVLFSASVSLLIFCLVDLSFGVNGVLQSPKMNALHSISSFTSVSISFTYAGAPVLGAYIFIMVISSCWTEPFIFMQCPSLSLVTLF